MENREVNVSKKFLFDTETVEALRPGEKEQLAWDEGLEGFGVRILPSGTRSWIFSFRESTKDGSVRRRRITIGRLGDMSLEEARNAARKVLADAMADGGEERNGVPPEVDVAEGPEERVVETEASAAEEERPGAAEVEDWIDPDEEEGLGDEGARERFDPETGEVISAGVGDDDGGWVDEDLNLEDVGPSPDTRSGAFAEEEDAGPDIAVVEDVLSGVFEAFEGEGKVRVAVDAGWELAREPGAGGVSDDGEDTEAVVDGGSSVGEVSPGPSKETEVGEVSGVGSGEMVRRVGGAMAKAAGQAIRLGRKGRDMAEAARTDRGSKETPEGEVGLGGRDAGAAEDVLIEEAPAPARLVKRLWRTEGTEGGQREGKDVSDETVLALARNLDEVRGQMDRIAENNESLVPQLEEVSTALRVFSKDFRNWRRRWMQPALAVAVLMPVLLGAGMAIQSQAPLLPQHDPSLGWSGHIWEHYGSAFMECFERANKGASGKTRCELEVRAR